MTRCRGEALVLDLGSGRRPLVAMLTQHPTNWNFPKYRERFSPNWGECAPFTVLSRLYGFDFKYYGDSGENISTLIQYRGARDVDPSSGNLPGLVTFADINNPASVMPVDPNDLSATLGPGVKWHKITLEIVSPGLWPFNLIGITGEPLTTGIEKKLPWIPEFHDKMFDGSRVRYSDERGGFSNSLSTWSLRMGM